MSAEYSPGESEKNSAFLCFTCIFSESKKCKQLQKIISSLWGGPPLAILLKQAILNL